MKRTDTSSISSPTIKKKKDMEGGQITTKGKDNNMSDQQQQVVQNITTSSPTHEEEEDYSSYKTIEEFGYRYNDKGQLRSIKDDSTFKFVTQEHYDALGDVVATTIQKMMTQEPYHLIELQIPEDNIEGVDPTKPHTNIFLSDDFYANEERLLIIICGSGRVVAGQWARSICINDTLGKGTIFEYLEQAKKNNFSFIILNPNQTRGEYIGKNGKPKMGSVPGSETPYNHVQYVYDHYIVKSKAKAITIIAHSFGGQLTMHILESRPKIMDKLKAIGLTDSVHSHSVLRRSNVESDSEDDDDDNEQNTQYKYTKAQKVENNKKVLKFISNNCINWVASKQPVGQDLGFSTYQSCQHRSSGHTKHEYTSSSYVLHLTETPIIYLFIYSFKSRSKNMLLALRIVCSILPALFTLLLSAFMINSFVLVENLIHIF
ncbi:esterase/lipase/thioesterase domain-containing protein [Cavenderia fasciculata]|uniref:Esterase/lipase/thioesterase domain-containing protein n=1 Tax=Cavenderia fasciculata TaxID=261658 RepID=F4PV23_CACFS|nr:esterase/lipase/thioesterase domain-containing protein [Cavenderia fasciculata]EGG21139.1 esterase/lipase/thioesterase domain-containing protein [Cavenderia fasciculata]|eukprot:XP_004358989.1 esterase/lipase/thioesterase domain-containing protein [Cavenderia fasciculata]